MSVALADRVSPRSDVRPRELIRQRRRRSEQRSVAKEFDLADDAARADRVDGQSVMLAGASKTVAAGPVKISSGSPLPVTVTTALSDVFVPPRRRDAQCIGSIVDRDSGGIGVAADRGHARGVAIVDEHGRAGGVPWSTFRSPSRCCRKRWCRWQDLQSRAWRRLR